MRKWWLECESQLVSQLTESPTTKYTPLNLDASPRQVYDKFQYITKVDFKKQSRLSKWTVEEQDMMVNSGILAESKITEAKIKEFLPHHITEKYLIHQIRTPINHLRKKML